MNHMKTTTTGRLYKVSVTGAANPTFFQPASLPSTAMRQFVAVRHETPAGAHVHVLECNDLADEVQD